MKSQFELSFVETEGFEPTYVGQFNNRFSSRSMKYLNCFPTCNGTHGHKQFCSQPILLNVVMTTSFHLIKDSNSLPDIRNISFVAEFKDTLIPNRIKSPLLGSNMVKSIKAKSNPLFWGKITHVFDSYRLKNTFVQKCTILFESPCDGWPISFRTGYQKSTFSVTVLVPDKNVKPRHDLLVGCAIVPIIDEHIHYHPVAYCDSPTFTITLLDSDPNLMIDVDSEVNERASPYCLSQNSAECKSDEDSNNNIRRKNKKSRNTMEFRAATVNGNTDVYLSSKSSNSNSGGSGGAVVEDVLQLLAQQYPANHAVQRLQQQLNSDYLFTSTNSSNYSNIFCGFGHSITAALAHRKDYLDQIDMEDQHLRDELLALMQDVNREIRDLVVDYLMKGTAATGTFTDAAIACLIANGISMPTHHPVVDVKPEPPFTTPSMHRRQHSSYHDEVNQPSHQLNSLPSVSSMHTAAIPLEQTRITAPTVSKRKINPHVTEVSMPDDMFKSFLDWMHSSNNHQTVVKVKTNECNEEFRPIITNKKIKIEPIDVKSASTSDKEFSAISFLAEIADHMLMKETLRKCIT
mmetsp:Transcript_9502/g.14200  ORF Transcript_9502/g.14200 Transcript_9502/m.14200 type:complete len:574 (-) Transcript_9502:254-1975(-)